MFRDPLLHDFEVNRLLHDLGSNLQILSEYNAEMYNDIYVSDELIEEIGGEAEYEAQRENIDDFLRMDLVDRHAYVDIVPRAGASELFVTRAANVLLIRRFSGDDALFVSIERDGSIGETIDTVERVAK